MILLSKMYLYRQKTTKHSFISINPQHTHTHQQKQNKPYAKIILRRNGKWKKNWIYWINKSMMEKYWVLIKLIEVLIRIGRRKKQKKSSSDEVWVVINGLLIIFRRRICRKNICI